MWYITSMKSQSLRWVADESTPNKTYVTRVINYGTWEEWQNMKKQYSRDQIMEAVKNPLRGQWTKRGKSFAEVVFECHLSNDALISYGP
jgi:hypothetical protein